MSFQLPSMDNVGTQILAALRGVATNDLPALNDFATKQLNDLKLLTLSIATGAMPNGWIDDENDLRDEMAKLRRVTVDFIHTMAALAVLALEKALNAVLGVVNGIVLGAFGLR